MSLSPRARCTSCFAISVVVLAASGCTTPSEPRDQDNRIFLSADPGEDAAKGGRPVVVARDDLEFLVVNSPLVFFGEVVAQEPFRDEDRGLVVTRNVFAIKEVIIGEYRQDTITLNVLGGTSGGKVMRVSHLPEFEPGGQYVVFTDPARTTYNPVTANEHGVFRVDPSTDAVYSASGFAVAGVEDQHLVFGSEQFADPSKGQPSVPAGNITSEPKIAGDVVRLQPTPTEARRALTYDRFAEAIRRIAGTR